MPPESLVPDDVDVNPRAEPGGPVCTRIPFAHLKLVDLQMMCGNSRGRGAAVVVAAEKSDSTS